MCSGQATIPIIRQNMTIKTILKRAHVEFLTRALCRHAQQGERRRKHHFETPDVLSRMITWIEKKDDRSHLAADAGNESIMIAFRP